MRINSDVQDFGVVIEAPTAGKHICLGGINVVFVEFYWLTGNCDTNT
jgi:hypothetical protein